MNFLQFNAFLTLVLLQSRDLVLATASGGGLRPNIIFIMADDLGYQDVGFRGSSIPTPNIDRLAKDGVILNNHYVMPQCSPTRASFLTGKSSITLGTWWGNLKPEQEGGLDLGERTIGDMLSGHGYKTHLVGKWHLGMASHEYTPVSRGFDTFLGIYLGSGHYFNHTNSGAYDMRYNYRAPNGSLVDQVMLDMKGQFSTHIYTNRTIDIIKEHNYSSHGNSTPFFIYLSYQAPHGPYMVSSECSKSGADKVTPARRIYSGMVTCLDAGVGRIVRELENTGLLNNTLIVFSSDNGAIMDKHGSNFPLRGGKKDFFEGGIRSVAFVYGNMLKLRGHVTKHLYHVMDWYPTFEYLAGGGRNVTKSKRKAARTREMSGVNIWESLNGGVKSREALLINIQRMDRFSASPEENAVTDETNIDSAKGDTDSANSNSDTDSADTDSADTDSANTDSADTDSADTDSAHTDSADTENANADTTADAINTEHGDDAQLMDLVVTEPTEGVSENITTKSEDFINQNYTSGGNKSNHENTGIGKERVINSTTSSFINKTESEKEPADADIMIQVTKRSVSENEMTNRSGLDYDLLLMGVNGKRQYSAAKKRKLNSNVGVTANHTLPAMNRTVVRLREDGQQRDHDNTTTSGQQHENQGNVTARIEGENIMEDQPVNSHNSKMDKDNSDDEVDRTHNRVHEYTEVKDDDNLLELKPQSRPSSSKKSEKKGASLKSNLNAAQTTTSVKKNDRGPMGDMIVYIWGTWKIIVGNEKLFKSGWTTRDAVPYREQQQVQQNEESDQGGSAETILLFELKSDPRERRNVAKTYPGMVEEMIGRVKRHFWDRVKPIYQLKSSKEGKRKGVWVPWKRNKMISR